MEALPACENCHWTGSVKSEGQFSEHVVKYLALRDAGHRRSDLHRWPIKRWVMRTRHPSDERGILNASSHVFDTDSFHPDSPSSRTEIYSPLVTCFLRAAFLCIRFFPRSKTNPHLQKKDYVHFHMNPVVPSFWNISRLAWKLTFSIAKIGMGFGRKSSLLTTELIFSRSYRSSLVQYSSMNELFHKLPQDRLGLSVFPSR